MKILLIAAFIAVALPASAHEWYDGDCCHDEDCAPLPFEAVTMTPDGYRIEIQPGEHPMLPAAADPFVATVPYTTPPAWPWPSIRPSQDGQFHACLMRFMGDGPSLSIRCLYVPMGV